MSKQNKRIWRDVGSLVLMAIICCALIQNRGAAADDPFISEVLPAGSGGASDEFIELYNPGEGELSLAGWEIRKKTFSGKEYSLWSGSTQVVPARSFFLIVPADHCGEGKGGPCYTGNVLPDDHYSQSVYLSMDSSLLLLDDQQTVVDQVAWGASPGACAANPAAGESLGRIVTSEGLQHTGACADDFSIGEPGPANSSMQASGVEPESGDIPEVPSSDRAASPSASVPTSSPSPDYGQLVVSEFLVNPAGEDGGMEFIEIHNQGTVAIDLALCSLADQVGKTSSYVFPSASVIGAGRYQVFFSSLTGISLNNAGDGVVLKDPKGGVIRETPVSPAGADNISFALLGGKWQETALPTPAGENVIRPVSLSGEQNVVRAGANTGGGVTQTEMTIDQTDEPIGGYDFSDEVLLNEVLPNPKGDDNRDGNWEWIEIRNSGRREISLRGWCVDDYLDKGSPAYCFPSDAILAAGGYIFLTGEQSGLLLNNTQEEVNLILPDGSLTDTISFAKAKEGYSYSRSQAGVWSWTDKPTPGKRNGEVNLITRTGAAILGKVLSAATGKDEGQETSGEKAEDIPFDPGSYETVRLADARQKKPGSLLVVSGLVAVAPDILGQGVFYLYSPEEKAGLRMIIKEDGRVDGSILSLGDQIQAYGSLDQAEGENQLALRSVLVLSSDNQLAALPLDLNHPEDALGSLVTVEGAVRDVSERSFYLVTAAEDVQVYAEEGTGLSFSSYVSGSRLRVTGIWSRTSGAYRLLPRFASDLSFLEGTNGGIMASSGTASADQSYDQSQLKLFFLLSFLITLDWTRMRIRSGKQSSAGHPAQILQPQDQSGEEEDLV